MAAKIMVASNRGPNNKDAAMNIRIQVCIYTELMAAKMMAASGNRGANNKDAAVNIRIQVNNELVGSNRWNWNLNISSSSYPAAWAD